MHCCLKFVAILPLCLPLACQDKGKDKEIEYRYIDSQAPVVDNRPPSDGQLDPAACPPTMQDRCDTIQIQIDAKQEEITRLAEAKDLPALNVAQLDLNELLEIRDAYQKGTEDVAPIQQRYQALRKILATSPNTLGTLSYQKEELAAVREVFNAIGELSIDPTTIAESAADKPKTVIFDAQESGLPWAAYWYPKRDKDLFEATDAPLRKLDAWLKTSRIVAWEEENYDKSSAEWEGLCDSWAMAAIESLEPTKVQIIDGVTFTPSDLKAIAIKYYEGTRPTIFGRRYQGVAATDGLIQDLRPEAFHRLVEEYVGKQKKHLIIDEDPGPEVWSKPLFRMAFNISKDATQPQALVVKAYPWMIRQRALVNDVPTSIAADLAAPTYEYRLYYDATPMADGRLKILAGEWIGSSLNSHPDTVFFPKSSENLLQKNPEIKKYSSNIRKLLEKAGMFKP